jgi:hypothetical protein
MILPNKSESLRYVYERGVTLVTYSCQVVVQYWFLEKLMLPLNNWITLILLHKGSVVEPVTHVEQQMCLVHVLISWFLLQLFHTFSKT